MEQLIGKTLDRYKVVELLGEGGMGAVFKGYDVTLQREVAIQVMHSHLSRKTDFQERFLQEARTAGPHQHCGGFRFRPGPGDALYRHGVYPRG